MKKFVRFSLLSIAAIALLACNEPISASSTSSSESSNESSNSMVGRETPPTSTYIFIPGPSVDLDTFTDEVNKLSDIPTPKRVVYHYTIHETLSGVWGKATDKTGKRLPDGTNITATATLTEEEGVSNPKPVGELNTSAMKNAVAASPLSVKGWMNFQKQNRDAYQNKETTILNYFQENFALNPLKTQMIRGYSRVGDGTNIDGYYSYISEINRTYREDGNVKEFRIIETTDVDGTVTEPMSNPEYMKAKWVVDIKCTLEYTF